MVVCHLFTQFGVCLYNGLLVCGERTLHALDSTEVHIAFARYVGICGVLFHGTVFVGDSVYYLHFGTALYFLLTVVLFFFAHCRIWGLYDIKVTKIRRLAIPRKEYLTYWQLAFCANTQGD